MNKKILICGEADLVKRGDLYYTTKTHWEILRLFYDQFAEAAVIEEVIPEKSENKFPWPPDVKLYPIELTFLPGKLKHLIWTSKGYVLPPKIKKIVAQYDIIYIRLPQFLSLGLFYVAKRLKKPTAISVHGDAVEVYRELLKKMNLPNPAKKLISKYLDLFDSELRKILRQTQLTLFVGDKLKEIYGNETKNSISFANFLHTESDIEKTPKISQTPPYKLLFVGELSERKGVSILAQSWLQLLKKGWELELHLVGEGPKREELLQMARSANAENRLYLHGFIDDRKKLLETFRTGDIFILPSIAGEGMPKVVMEAMCKGIPVIATDIGSTSYILERGNAGKIIPPKDLKALTEAIENLLKNPEERKKYALAGLEAAQKNTREQQMKKIREAFNEVFPGSIKPELLEK